MRCCDHIFVPVVYARGVAISHGGAWQLPLGALPQANMEAPRRPILQLEPRLPPRIFLFPFSPLFFSAPVSPLWFLGFRVLEAPTKEEDADPVSGPDGESAGGELRLQRQEQAARLRDSAGAHEVQVYATLVLRIHPVP